MCSTLWILAVFILGLAEHVSSVTYAIKPMFSSTSADTTISKFYGLYGGYYFEYQTGLKAFGYSTDYNSGAIKLFYNNGSKVASYNYPVSQQIAFTLVMKDPLKMFTIQNYTLILSFKLTLNSGVYTISPDVFTRDTKLGDVNNRYLKGIEKPATSYIFFASNGQYARAIRYDTSNNMAEYRSGVINNPGYQTYYIGIIGTQGNYYLKTTDSKFTETYDMLTLELIKVLSETVISCMGLVDNLSKELYFRATTANGIKSFNMTADIAGGTSHVAVSTTTVNGNYIPFFNLGSFQFFGVSPGGTKFVLLSKSTLATVFTSISLKIMFYSPLGAQEELPRAYFGFVHDVNSNFQTYYFEADACVTKVATTCTDCETGYYRSSTSANNYCLLPNQFPKGFGPDIVSKIMTACTTPNCGNCLSDYTICSGCPTTYLAYSGSCYLPQNLPVGVGVNPATNTTAAACLTSGCNNCSLDYNTCVECSSGKYLYSGSCISPASIPSGYGVSSPSNTVVPCATPACSACQANFSVCTACTSPKYLLNNICYSASSLPSGYGVNTTLNTVVSCAEVNCADCSTNASTCTTCKSGYNQLADACVQTVPDHYGFDNATSTLKPCQVSGCKTCASNFQVCTSCDPTRYLLSNACVTSAGIPAGYGVNTSSNTVVGCSGSGCADCTSDYSVCSGCVANRYLLNGVCYTSAGIPAGYGVNTSSNTGLIPCATPHCGSCGVDSIACVQCGGGYYLLNNTCYDSASIPSNYGIDENTLKSCIASNCQNCTANYTSCSSCESSYYEVNINGATSCMNKSNIPPGYGLTTLNTVSKCDDAYCIECLDNVNACHKCANNYYMFDNYCVYFNDVGDGLGVDPVSQEFVNCSDPHCKTCSQDYRVCVRCNGLDYFDFNGSCITSAEIPDGYGMDLTTNSVVECKDSNCKDCRANYSECLECTSSLYRVDSESKRCVFNMDEVSSDCTSFSARCTKCTNTSCLQCLDGRDFIVQIKDNKCLCYGIELNSTQTCLETIINSREETKFILASATWQASKISALLKFNKAASSNASTSGFNVTLSDKKNTFVLAPNDYRFKDNVYLYTTAIELCRLYDIDNGQLVVQLFDNSSYIKSFSTFFDSYPVVVKDVTMVNDATTQAVLQQASKPRAVIAYIASIALLAKGANTATMSDKMVSNFLYFRFLSGPTMYYTELIFDFLSQNAFVVLEINNPLENFSDDAKIKMPANYARRRVQANLFFNYGLETIFLYCMLAINCVISLTVRLDKTKKSLDNNIQTAHALDSKQESIKFKVMKYVQLNFGVRMIMAKLMGSMMEIMCYGLVNLYSLKFSLAMIVGLLQSLIFMCYFGGYSWVTYKVALSGNRDALLGERLENLRATKLSAFSVVYEGYNLNLKGAALFVPLVEIVRGLAVHSVLFTLSKSDVAQVAAILVIEMSYLCYIIQFRVKTSTIEHTLEILNAGSCMIYSGGQLASIFIADGFSRQKILGMALGCVLVITILLNFTFILLQLVKTLMVEPVKLYLLSRQHSLASIKQKSTLMSVPKKQKLLSKVHSMKKGVEKDPECFSNNSSPRARIYQNSPLRKKVQTFSAGSTMGSNKDVSSPQRQLMSIRTSSSSILGKMTNKSGLAKFQHATGKLRIVRLVQNDEQSTHTASGVSSERNIIQTKQTST